MEKVCNNTVKNLINNAPLTVNFIKNGPFLEKSGKKPNTLSEAEISDGVL